MIFSIVDIKMFVIRLVIFFLVIGILMSLFVALREINKGSELERKLNEMGEAMLASDFTISRAVFDPLKEASVAGVGKKRMADLNNSPIEPLHYCDNLACFEFLSDEDGKKVSRYKLGPCDSVVLGKSKDWTIWLSEAGTLKPGLMRVTLTNPVTEPLYLKGAREIACSIEKAGLYKAPITLDPFSIACGATDCEMSYTDNTLCVQQYTIGIKPVCRYIGRPVGLPAFLTIQTKKVTVTPVPAIDGASEKCPNPTTFTTDADRSKYDVKSVVVCEITA